MIPPVRDRRLGRALIVGTLLLLSFGAIGLRAFQLQLLKGREYYVAAERQHRRFLPLASKRGTLFSRNLRELAVTLDVDSLYAVPNRVQDPEVTARRLAGMVPVSQKELASRLGTDRSFIWVKRWVDDPVRGALEKVPIEGVGIVKEGKRFYPNQQLAGQVLGFAGMDGQGLEGVELSYDRDIRGRDEAMPAERDALGRLFVPAGIRTTGEPEGFDLVLTLDETIQHIAEKELSRGVERVGAKGGTVVVLDPSTGEILAMANYPGFDPNRFWRYQPAQWRNRAITDLIEPGSTLKPFVVAGSLDDGVLKGNDLVYTERGKFTVGGKVVHDVHPQGWLTVADVVRVSSNIGAAKVGLSLGRERLHQYLARFGFLEPSGVDLKGERRGLSQPLKDWSRLTVATVSFGQGIAITPLQLTNAYAAIANGGLLMRPYLVKRVVDKEGRVVRENHPQILRRVIRRETAQAMREMLLGVTTNEGTGKRADLEGYLVAGKTGTAQKPAADARGYSRDKFVSSFVGWVPASDPRLLISVVIDEPVGVNYGGVVAAPVFREVASQALAYFRIQPDNAEEIKVKSYGTGMGDRGTPEYIPDYSLLQVADDGRATMPDFAGMGLRQVMKLAASKRVRVETAGTGVAISQMPEAGATLGPKEVGRVNLAPPSQLQ